MKKHNKKPFLPAPDVENHHNQGLVPTETIENRILLIRGQKVMLDKDLAILYGVSSKRLNEKVKRNIKRFPEDFMFQLNALEAKMVNIQIESLRSQFATLENNEIVSKRGRHRKYMPYAFTEQGIAMLSSVLNSDRAILVNIAIMRAFVKIRNMITFNKDLAKKLSELEHIIGRHDQDIISLFREINKIVRYEQEPKERIGFIK